VSVSRQSVKTDRRGASEPVLAAEEVGLVFRLPSTFGSSLVVSSCATAVKYEIWG
jgi:hypothetical protein